ncbi:hypothetical protein CR513_03913, partial [Mucuna pruriens]
MIRVADVDGDEQNNNKQFVKVIMAKVKYNPSYSLATPIALSVTNNWYTPCGSLCGRAAMGGLK